MAESSTGRNKLKPGAGAVRLTKPERDELRRDQILAAARACVVRHGFHAASMALIAQEARMSVGQIYRHFDNKEAIIHAIVDKIVTRRVERMSREDLRDLPRRLASRDQSHGSTDEEDRVLLLEVAAEAARNTTVAQLLRDSDERLHAHAVTKLRRAVPGLSKREAVARVEVLAVLFEGTDYRRTLQRQADPTRLQQLLRQIVDTLHSPPAAALQRRRPGN